MDPLFAVLCDANDGGLTDAGQLVQGAFDVLGEHVQSLQRHDHLLLPPLDEQSPLGIALADVSGVQPSVGVDRGTGTGARVRTVVTARHVLPADEDLAVVGNPHLDACDRFADRSLPCAT